MADEQNEKEIIDGTGNTTDASSTATALKGIFDGMADGEKPADTTLDVSAQENAADAFGNGEQKPAEDAHEAVTTDDASTDTGTTEASTEATGDEKPEGEKPKADDGTKEEHGKAATDDEDLSDITEADLAPSPMDKPKTQRRIKALLKKVQETSEIAATTKKELEEKAAKLAELEKKLTVEGDGAKGQLGEDVQKQLEELAMYRRQSELETDPSIKEKFDAVIEQRESDIETILKRNEAGDGLIKLIKDEGGLAKFSRSNKSFKLADGKAVTAAQIFQRIRTALEDTNPADAIELTAALQDQSRLSSEKKRFVEAEKTKAVSYFEERRKKQEEYQAGIKTKVEGWVKKITESDEDFKPLAVPADAPPEKITEIAEENRYRKQLAGVLQASLQVKNPDEYLEMVLDATKAYPLRRELDRTKKALTAKDEEITKLKAELDKVRSAGSSIPKKEGSLGGPRGGEPAKKPAAPPSIEDAFDAVARGQ